MVEAPERIWAYHNGNSQTYLTSPNKFHNVEYVRADLYEQVKRERDEALAKADVRENANRYLHSVITGDAERLAGERVVITPEMVNAAWNKGKDLRMTGLPSDFRSVLEAAIRSLKGGRDAQ